MIDEGRRYFSTNAIPDLLCQPIDLKFNHFVVFSRQLLMQPQKDFNNYSKYSIYLTISQMAKCGFVPLHLEGLVMNTFICKDGLRCYIHEVHNICWGTIIVTTSTL